MKAKKYGKTIEESISIFKDAMNCGMEYITAACEEYVHAIDNFKNGEREYRKAYPCRTEFDWKNIEDIGRGKLSVYALLCPNEFTINAVRTLPRDTQDILVGTASRDAVPQTVVVGNVKVTKPVAQMNAAETRLLIDEKAGKIRTVDEQVAKCADKVKSEDCWYIRNGMLIVTCRSSFCIEEVAEILRKMKGGK